MLRDAKGSIVILTGAGISKESGLDTFRDADGIWAKVRVEDVATPAAFVHNPGFVHEFYNARRAQLRSGTIEPNAAHYALAQLEREWPGEVLLVTQNIDNLHGRAGSRQLIHMHGELMKARCSYCETVFPWIDDLSTKLACDKCGRRGGMRPHVVWFGEVPLEMDRIFEAISQCSLFISIGTSGHVYPAAGFVDAADNSGAHTIELNLEPSAGASRFNECIHGAASTVVPAFIARLLAGP